MLLLAEVADRGDVDDELWLWWKCGRGNERRSDRADESLRDEWAWGACRCTSGFRCCWCAARPASSGECVRAETNVGSSRVCGGVWGMGDVEGDVDASESVLSLQCEGSEGEGAGFVCAPRRWWWWWGRGEGVGSETVMWGRRAGKTRETMASWCERRSDSWRVSW